jgi:NAD(P)-dependent dehydrogenase (short-subunit alcohol dehydrogenase family)
VGDPPDRSEELLRRAQRLEERAGKEVAAVDRRSSRRRAERLGDTLEEVAWLARGVRRVRVIAAESRQVLAQLARYTGPLAVIVRALASAAAFVAHRASHVKVGDDVFEFSPKKAARSVVALVLLPVLAYVVYNLATRHSGVFLINDKHLVSGETDEYQIGGCWQVTPEQRACEKGQGVIVLIRPAWIPDMGIFSVTYDDDVGVVPLQGRCHLGTYGIYLRVPWLPFLRGALKPIAIEIGRCDGIASSGTFTPD